MFKPFFLMSALASVCTLFVTVTSRADAISHSSWNIPIPPFTLEESGETTILHVASEDYTLNPDAVGFPAIPGRTLLVAIEDGLCVSNVTASILWETVAQKIRLQSICAPIRQGATNIVSNKSYDAPSIGTCYPNQAIHALSEEISCGVRLLPIRIVPFRWYSASGQLERATNIVVHVTYARASAKQTIPRKIQVAPDLLEQVRAMVINPEDIRENTRRNDISLSEKVDYLLLSPPDFVEDWIWYVQERKKVHTNIIFKVKNTAEIYDEYPFPTAAQRNAAESIHAYLRANRASMQFSYVVLGGAWLDAQNLKKSKPQFYGGEEMTLSNCVPGVYGYPREDWREIPSDMFYACLDMINNQQYPWDANENNVYIDQNDCSKNDLRPDVCVSRITLNNYRPNNLTAYNRHELVTNYVEKLARGESKLFNGHFKYGLAPDSTGSRRSRVNGERMHYDELEFYDNMRNMFDPRHSTWIEDNEVEPRRRIKDQFAKWRPVLDTKGMMSFTWTRTAHNLSEATDDYYAGDRDYGFVYSHGWAQGATHFQAGRFATCKGLTILNGSNGPCDTGYPDYHVNMGGIPTLQYNLGDSGVSNPEGGALASINNTRWGWAGGSATGRDFDSSMSYFMLNRSLEGFNNLYLDVGHAWFKGVNDYASFGYTQGGGTHTWTLTEQICYGDPLVRLPAPEDRWWAGGATGVWDLVSENWTNTLNESKCYYSASNVYFNAFSESAITVTQHVGALRLSIPILSNGRFSITGENGASLRVMRTIDVAGGNLALDIAGGVGHEGITFRQGLENENETYNLTFQGTNEFYVAKVTGASQIDLLGGGAILDLDNFPKDTLTLHVNGPGREELPLPNTLRARTPGALNRFANPCFSNSWIQLATVDAFGRDTPANVTLANTTLEIAANAHYERKGWYQTVNCAENLNATFAVTGNSSIRTSTGGLWMINKTTTFNLDAGAHLTLAAQSVDAGGKVIINGGGETVLEVPLTDALSGDVEVGPGVRLVLDALPLENVRSLTLAAGAELVLPHARSGYWQILNVSSKFSCEAGVAVYDSSDTSHPLDGTPSTTGSFFEKDALYTWTKEEGDWNASLAKVANKIVFADVTGGVARVHVTQSVTPDFAYFANPHTQYTFDGANAGASIGFSGIVLSGETCFDLPITAYEYVELRGGTSTFSRVVTPYVSVGRGSTLVLAGSHWTTFQFQDGAILQAVDNTSLDWNQDTSFEFENDDTQVILDTRNLDLSGGMCCLIRGEGHIWTPEDLTHFALCVKTHELRIVNGELWVTQGDGLEAPYTLSWTGTTNWNTSAWLCCDGVAFPKPWAECTLDTGAEINLEVHGTHATLTMDCTIEASTLIATCDTNETFTLTHTEAGSVHAGTLDLRGIQGCMHINTDTQDATILTPTNTQASTILHTTGSGLVRMNGSSVRFEKPGAWILGKGAQGVLTVVLPHLRETMRIAYLETGFEYKGGEGGFEVRVEDYRGTLRQDCTVKTVGTELVVIPPALHATIPAGTNDLTAITWQDANGSIIEDAIDWTRVEALNLTGEAGSVLTSVTHFVDFPTKLTLTGALTLAGEARWKCDMFNGTGNLTLSDSFTMEVNLATDSTLLNNKRIRVTDTSYLLVNHGNDTRNLTDQNWSNITGTGTLAFTGGTGKWVAPPRTRFAHTLSFHSDVDIVLTEDVKATAPLDISNLSGTGYFRMDWNSQTHARTIRTTQTTLSEYTGRISAPAGERNAELIVRSDDTLASTNKALILSGNAIAAQALKIEPMGCVILTGNWLGQITVEGILAVTNACVTNNLTITLCDNGQILILDNVPKSALYAPSDPQEETPEETPEEKPNLFAFVPAGETRWSELTWYTTNTHDTASVQDWARVESVTLLATQEEACVVFDRSTFTGALVLRDNVKLETHVLPNFVLSSAPTGTIEIIYTTEPTANTILVKTATDFAYDSSVFSVTTHNRFGTERVVPASIAYQNGGFYVLVQAIDAPTYSFTFDGSTYKTLTSTIALSGNTESPSYFETSRNGQALTGFSPYFKSGIDIPSKWSLNIVARMPAATGGIIFGMGKGPYSARGLGLVYAGEDRVALAIWNGWTSQYLITADVSFATRQFHAYTILSDSQTLAFYVDGKYIGSRQAANYPAEGHCQILGCHSGYPNGITGGGSGALDDWRFYSGTYLTPESIAGIAKEFPPWPECCEGLITYDDTSLETLEWSEGDVTMPRILVGNGGSINLDKTYTFTQSVQLSGEPITLKVAECAQLNAEGGLIAGTPLTLDASLLNGTNMAKNAVQGAPWSRWLIRGSVRGDIRVAGLPSLPQGYRIETETRTEYGVRLIISAPRIVRFGSVNINFAGGRNNTFDQATKLAGNTTYATLQHGAHSILGSDWNDLPAQNGTTTLSHYLNTAGERVNTLDIQLSATQVNNPYDTGNNAGDRLLYGYIDDGQSPIVTITNIPFAQYRVIVYRATDQESTVFSSVRIGTCAEDAKAYYGPTTDDSTGGVTISGETNMAWGDSDIRATLTEGVNYVVSDVLTGGVNGASLYISSPRHTGRAGVAGIQIVEVGYATEVDAVDYTANIVHDTLWENGKGAGLTNATRWYNDPISTITLTTQVAQATLTFETAVTADVLRVIGETNHALTLTTTVENTSNAAIATLDFTSAQGSIDVTTSLGATSLIAGRDTRLTGTRDNLAFVVEANKRLTLSSAIDWTSQDAISTGGHVHFAGTRNLATPPITIAGAIVSYEDATLRRTGEEYTVLRTEDTDHVVYNANNGILYNVLDVCGGELILTNTASQKVLYFGGGKTSHRNSIISVSGGRLTLRVSGTGTSNTDCGLLLSTTDSAWTNPSITISGGILDLDKGHLTLWEKSDITLSGGTLRTGGLRKQAGGASTFTMRGGTLALGSGGFTLNNGKRLSVTCSGGCILAEKSCAIAITPTISGIVELDASAGETLTLSSGANGTGTLRCGATGTIRLQGSGYANLTLEGTFAIQLTDEQSAQTCEFKLFSAAENFNLTQVTVLGSDDNNATNGILRQIGTSVNWLPHTAALRVDGRAINQNELFAHSCSTSQITQLGGACVIVTPTNATDNVRLRFNDSTEVSVPRWYDIHTKNERLSLALNAHAIPEIAAVTNETAILPAIRLEDTHFHVGVPNAITQLWYRLEGYLNLDDKEPTYLGDWTRGQKSLSCPKSETSNQGFYRIRARDY